jgi:hypothetical protein
MKASNVDEKNKVEAAKMKVTDDQIYKAIARHQSGEKMKNISIDFPYSDSWLSVRMKVVAGYSAKLKGYTKKRVNERHASPVSHDDYKKIEWNGVLCSKWY